MMEILEKLPGITIERYTVMERSYTFAGFESFQPRRNAGLALSKDSTNRQDKKISLPRRNSASNREKVVQSERIQIDLNKAASKEFFRKKIKENPTFRHQPRPRSQRGSKIELEVLGKNPGSLSGSSLNMFNENDEVLPKEDVFSPDQAPLKSILKRPGSGLSIKSCRSLGVMSLDSGMARLAASLLSHKTRKTGKHEENQKKSQHLHGNRTILNREEDKNPELSTLPLLGSKSNHGLQTATKSPEHVREDARVVSLSPSKSVSFKLDPEIKETEGLSLNKKGDAKWRVALSSYQEQIKSDHPKATVKKKFQNSRTRTDKANRVIISRGHRNHVEDAEMAKAYKTAETSNKKLGFVHSQEDGTSSLTQIHRLSDPYRKYLITRATEPTQRYPHECDVGNPDQTKHKMLNREASEAAAILRKAKRTFAKQQNPSNRVRETVV